MIFLTADLHLSHRNCLKYCGRPFFTVKQMNEEIIRRWNEVVGPADSVYVLGDLTFSINRMKEITPRLNGLKFLVLGNHDPIFSRWGKKQVDKYMPEYVKAGWHDIVENSWFNLPEGRVNLSHFPYRKGGDQTFHERFTEYRLENDGKPLICGHIHNSAWLKKDNMMNVGVDVWNYYPVPLDAVMELFKYPGDIPAPNKWRSTFWKLWHSIWIRNRRR